MRLLMMFACKDQFQHKQCHNRYGAIKPKQEILQRKKTVFANTNGETVMVIHFPQLAKHVTHEMDRLWRRAEIGITSRMQRTLQQRRKGCGRAVQSD